MTFNEKKSDILRIDTESTHDDSHISAGTFWHILTFLKKEYGFDADTFMRERLGCVVGQHDSSLHIHAHHLGELFADASRFTGEPHLSFRLAEALDPHSFGLLGYLLIHSANVGDMLEKMCTYHPLVGKTLKPILLQTKNRYKLTFVSLSKNGFSQLTKYQAEIHFAATLSLLNRLSAYTVAPEYATFAYSKPTDISEYRRVFGEKLYFDEEENALIFSKEALAVETICRDRELLEFFENKAQIVLQDTTCSELQTAITRAFFDDCGHFSPDLLAVAKRLGLHPRSVQKKLRDENTTFATIVAHTRFSLAKKYLLQGSDATEVAIRLGYAELSSFIRAFRSWSDMTPKEWARNNVTTSS